MFETTKGIITADDSTDVGIQTWAPLMAQSIDDLLPFMWADQDAMDDTETDNLVEGTMGYRIDQGNQAYVWTGSTWIAKPIGEVGDHLIVGSYNTTSQTDISIRRNYGGVDQEVLFYIPASADPSGAMIVREGSNNLSRLTLYENGNLTVQTYAGSSTPTAIRFVPFAMAAGINSITPVANANTQLTVTFPAGRFTQPPEVVVTPSTTVAGNTVEGWAATAVTTSSFVLNVRRINTTSTSLRWIAVQMREEDSHG